MTQSAAAEYNENYECPQCGDAADRIPSAASFTFKGGTPGNSGVHDMDYPSADKAVGRSASKKWEIIHKKQEDRAKIRKEAGTNSLMYKGDDVVAAPKRQMAVRENALKTAKQARKA